MRHLDLLSGIERLPSESLQARALANTYSVLHLVDRLADRDDTEYASREQLAAAAASIDLVEDSTALTLETRRVARELQDLARNGTSTPLLAALVGLLSPLVDNDFRDSVREVVANVLILGGATLDPELEWRACRFRAGANIADGNLDSATADYEAIADIASKCGSPDGDVVAKNGLALVLHLRGNLPAAEARVRELIAIADARCSRAIRVRVRLNLGVVLGKRSRFEEALSELEAALALAETSRHEDEFGDRESIVADIAFTYVQLGNVEAARRIYTALTFSAKTIRIATGARINLMHIAGLRGDSQSVRQLQGELNARPMQTRLQVDYLLTLGVACNAIGDIEQAKIALERCLDLASRTGFGQYLIEADRRIKRISELLSSGDEAKTHRFVDRVVGRAVRALAD